MLILARFLLAQLYLDSLMGKTTEDDIQNALERLPTGSEAYDLAYKDAMERIEQQDKDGKRLAKQVLSWIVCTKRALITAELQQALAVKIGEFKFHIRRQPDIEDMVSVCAGLVTVDEESGIIRLVHYTTQEYFERTQKDWFPDAETNITRICVTYLSFSIFESGFCRTDDEFEERLQLNPLYDYAARNWGHHAHAALAEVEQLVVNLLKSEAKVSGCSQAMMASRSYFGYSQSVPKQVKGVHLAAYFGLGEVIVVLLEGGYDLDSKDSYGRTPLSYAARNGHEAVVRLLLENGAKLETKSNNSQTPLSYAAENGHEAVVRLLLENGAELETKNNDGQTPLSYAARNGHEAVVKLLLELDAELETKDKWYGRTPLSYAAINGHEAVVKLLLENGAELKTKDDEHGQMPLSWAAIDGPRSYAAETPLSYAARNGQLLLEFDAKLKAVTGVMR